MELMKHILHIPAQPDQDSGSCRVRIPAKAVCYQCCSHGSHGRQCGGIYSEKEISANNLYSMLPDSLIYSTSLAIDEMHSVKCWCEQ